MIVRARPRRLSVVCRVVAVAVLAVFGAIALVLPRGQTGGREFGVADQLAFFGLGLLLAVAVLALTRAAVRADGTGIWVRNVLGERFFPWGVVVGVHLPEGAPWAQLELHDDEVVGLLAVQAGDGDRSVEVVLALRDLLQTSRQQ